MGVTTGYYRVRETDFQNMLEDEAYYQRRMESRYDSDDFFDMDKAGWGLLLILNPTMALIPGEEPDFEPSEPPPTIAKLLSFGGATIHPNIIVGLGPSQYLPLKELGGGLKEFENLDFEAAYQVANSELISEALMTGPIDRDEFRGYYWSYLQGILKWVEESMESYQQLLLTS